jgi:hypothetical protein
MTAAVLTPAQLMLLREALGLSHYQRAPIRHNLPAHAAKGREDDVAALERMGYLRTRMFAGEGGWESVTEITAEGEACALANSTVEGS